MKTEIVKQLVEIEVRSSVLYTFYKAYDKYGNVRIEYCNFFLNKVKSMDKLYAWAQKHNVRNGTILTYETGQNNKDPSITNTSISFVNCIFKLLSRRIASLVYPFNNY